MKSCILLFFFLLFLSACEQPVYVPNKTHVPMFRKDDKVFIDAASVGTSGSAFDGIENTSGYEIMAAVSPIEHFYVEGGGNSTFKALKEFENNLVTTFYYGALGGYYWFTPSVALLFSGGFGEGRTQSYVYYSGSMLTGPAEYEYTQSIYHRAHLLASLGLSLPLNKPKGDGWKDYSLEAALSYRLSHLWTKLYRFVKYDEERVVVETTYDKFINTFGEPSFIIRLGVTHLMLELQIGGSGILSDKNHAIPRGKNFSSLGLISRF